MYIKIKDTTQSVSFHDTGEGFILNFDENINENIFKSIEEPIGLYADDDIFLMDIDISKYDIKIADNVAYLYTSLSLEEIKIKKINELDKACENTIYAGTDVTLSDGSVEHFTLDMKDQLDLSGIGLQLLSGEQQIAWHKDDSGESCKFYSADDGQAIISTLTAFRTYHITYFRDLRIYVNSLEDKEAVKAVYYGYEIPDDFKSEVLKAIENTMKSEEISGDEVNGDES